MIKTLILLSISLPLLSCDDFFNRYDPVEAGKNIFVMESLIFEKSTNPLLHIDAFGGIDQDNMTITISTPPNFDLDANKLIGRAMIKPVGSQSEDNKEIQIDRYWKDGETLELDRKDFDSTWLGDSTLTNKYALIMNRVFISKLSMQSAQYSSSPNFVIRLRFNDVADPDILGPASFLSGIQIPPGINSISAVDFTPALNVDATSYDLNITATVEGLYQIRLQPGSVASIPTNINNLLSNKVTFFHDTTPPVTSVVPITVLDLDRSIGNITEAQVTLRFEQATDNLTLQNSLQYSFFFSNNNTDLNDLAVNIAGLIPNKLPYKGNEFVPYQSEYTWSYDEMPGLLQGYLNGSPIFFNVIAEDMAQSKERYDQGNQSYTGP